MRNLGGMIIGGVSGLIAGAGIEALFRKTAYDISATVIEKTGGISLPPSKMSSELMMQYHLEMEKGGLRGFLAWKIYGYASHGGGLPYDEMPQTDLVIIILAAIVGAIIGAIAMSKRGWALILIIGLAAWGISNHVNSIHILGNIIGRAVVLTGGAIGGAISLIVVEVLRNRQEMN